MLPNSQVFLFSTAFCSTIDDWFAGNVVVEQEVGDVATITNEDLRLICNHVRFVKGVNFTKVTTVINYNEQGLLLAVMSGQFAYICKLDSKASYKHMRNLLSAGFFLCEAREHLLNFDDLLGTSYKYLRTVKGSSVKPFKIASDAHISELADSTDRLTNHIVDTFDKLFKCGF